MSSPRSQGSTENSGGDLAGTIYLDNAATSYPKPERVFRAMDDFARNIGGSGGRSSHRRAIESSTMLDGARENLARLLGARGPDCICFAQNATDALNVAIYGLAEPGRRIVTSKVEHNSVRRPLADLRARMHCDVVAVGADSRGFWDPRELIAAIDKETALVVVAWASNVTGALQDLEPVARACRALGVPLVVDAAQIAGAYPVDVKSEDIAAFAFTGHKSLLGPQGTGGLCVDPELGAAIRPLRRGGSGTLSHSEVHPEFLPDRFEAGTLNGHGLAGLSAGASYLLERGIEDVRKHEMLLWRRLRDGCKEIRHVKAYGPDDPDRSVSIVSVTVEGMEPTDVGFLLDMRYGVLTRTGLHCAPGAHEAIGTLPTGTIRFSMGFANTEADIDAALEGLSHVRERAPRRGKTLAAAHAVTSSAEAPTGATKTYRLDSRGFLVDPNEWDEEFAKSAAYTLSIEGGLTDEHWRVIRFLRAATEASGRVPLVHRACKELSLALPDLERLFPTGYLRGACKIAGLSYRSAFYEPAAAKPQSSPLQCSSYPVDAEGYLSDPDLWDERFACATASDLGLASLTERHWQIIRFLRRFLERTEEVPTVFMTCSSCDIGIEALEQLFPTGYHRGAIKVAGLRLL